MQTDKKNISLEKGAENRNKNLPKKYMYSQQASHFKSWPMIVKVPSKGAVSGSRAFTSSRVPLRGRFPLSYPFFFIFTLNPSCIFSPSLCCSVMLLSFCPSPFLLPALLFSALVISSLAINACEISNGGCSAKADCKRTTPGSRTCVCKAGYTGDGIVCLGKRHPSSIWSEHSYVILMSGCCQDRLFSVRLGRKVWGCGIVITEVWRCVMSKNHFGRRKGGNFF